MRRILKPILIGVSLLLVVALVAVIGLSFYVGRRPLPTTQGSRTLEGLIDEVTIIRNGEGVPDIYANNDADLFFAQGYVQAQDRFFEMDYRRHVTAGRLSELVGAVPEAIEADAVVRTLGWRRVAEQEWEQLSGESREYVQAFSEGVNAYIEHREASELALEYTVLGVTVAPRDIEPWSPVDSLAWLKAMAWDLRSNFDEELERAVVLRSTGDLDRVNELFPEYPYASNFPIISRLGESADPESTPDGADATEGEAAPEGEASALIDDAMVDVLYSASEALNAIPVLYGDGDAVGSNSFVIAGDHTATGEPLLANDPHLDSGAPGIWYQSGLHCRELSENCTFDVSGFTFAGLPGVIIGQNADLGWGLTNMGADVTDFFLERVRSDGTYSHGDAEGLQLTTRTETILVAEADPVELRIEETIHGPIVSGVLEATAAATGRPKPPGSPPTGVDGYDVSLAWTALEPGRTMDAIFDINRATNAGDIAAAAALFDVPAQNIVFATADGDIGYQAPGRIPIRAESITEDVPGMDSSWPRLGWDPQFDWQGFVLAENMPRALNPDEGFIVAANQAVTAPGESVYLTDDWDYGFRAQRLRELIEEKIAAGEAITVEDANAFMMDSASPNAEKLIDAIDSLDITDPYLATAIAQLHLWRDEGLQNDVDSAGAAYFNAVWAHLLELTFADELDPSAWPYGGSRSVQVMNNLLEDPGNRWWDYVPTVHVTETRDEILLQALTHARNELTNRISSDATRWRWGYLHEARLQHPILSEDVMPGPLGRLTNPAPFEVSGSSTSPLATAWDASVHEDDRMDYRMTTSPSMRMVVNPVDRDASTWVTATGVSGHPTSRHYADQIGAWAAGEHYAWNVTPGAVEAAAVRTLTLYPNQ
ncbi:MAG: penicillin acylase family protein [Ruaniaceae bacterium]|nr:penicillin acylase family protein [Ruaniaceae bacterium]